MRVSTKTLFFQMYKLPLREQWSGPDGVYTNIATNLCCNTQTVLKFIMRLDADNLDVAVQSVGSGDHNKKIRLSNATDDALIRGLEANFGQSWTTKIVTNELSREAEGVSQQKICNTANRLDILRTKRQYQNTAPATRSCSGQGCGCPSARSSRHSLRTAATIAASRPASSRSSTSI